MSSNYKTNKFIFTNSQCPGDILCMTSGIRDLHRAYPGRYITDVDTTCMEIWENNPYITKLDRKDPDVEVVMVDNNLIHSSNQGPYHFIESFTRRLEKILGIDIPDRLVKGDVHISDEEKGWYSQVNDVLGQDLHYWIIVSGGKSDYTAKHWHPGRMQEVINHFNDIIFVQVGEAHHMHKPLVGDNLLNLVGKTDFRQLIRLVYHSSGVICPVTSLMHLAAAVEVREDRCYGLKNRPCIVLAGGREPARWENYGYHTYLHSCGQLPCCSDGGCWKSRVEPIGDGDHKDGDLCSLPILTEGGITLPKCLDLIKSSDVIRAVETYLTGSLI